MWKVLLQHFPGASVLLGKLASAAAEASVPPSTKTETNVPVQRESLLKPLFLSTSGLEEVSAALIFSPLAGESGMHRSFQRPIVDVFPRRVDKASIVDGWSAVDSYTEWNEEHKSTSLGNQTYPHQESTRQDHHSTGSQTNHSRMSD